MEALTSGIAKIRHRETGVVYEIEANELEWEQNGGRSGGWVPSSGTKRSWTTRTSGY